MRVEGKRDVLSHVEETVVRGVDDELAEGGLHVILHALAEVGTHTDLTGDSIGDVLSRCRNKDVVRTDAGAGRVTAILRMCDLENAAVGRCPARALTVLEIDEVLEADEVRDELGLRVRVDLLRAIQLLDDAVVHDRDLITDREALLLVMGDVDRGEAELLLQLPDLNTHLHAELRVEVTERLVEEHEIRLDDHRTGEGYTLTLSAGHLLRQALLEAVEVDRVEHLHDALLDLCLRQIATTQAERDVLEDVHVREQRVALEHEAEVPLMQRHMGVVLSVEEEVALHRLREAADQAERRGFATAAGAEEADQLALLDVQVQILQNDVLSISCGDIS